MTNPHHRTGFGGLRAGGLNWDALPLRLFVKGNKKFWDPADIDLGRDAEDFAALSAEERELTTLLCAQFLAGEEAVTEDLQPFMAAMAAEGRLGDEMYLTQFCFEEAKHTQVFRMWLDAVGVTEDLHPLIEDNPGYRRIFYEALPECLNALREDHSPTAQVRAAVTYNQLVEGVLALTGYFSWNKVCTMRGILPGMQEIVQRIGDDERRHMAWGTFTCRRHVAADDANWQVVTDRMGELLPHAVEQIEHVMRDHVDNPFGLTLAELVDYASNRAMRRLGAIESARGGSVERIDLDASPEQLEEQFHDEDARELAAVAS